MTPDSDSSLWLSSDTTSRQDALDVTRSFIVQAPAGSGKTELLIQRYLKLLSVVSNPEEILAITFTRKAAAEMQVRVLDALQVGRSGTPPTEAHRRITFDLARAALARSAQLQWDLIENPRRMRIMTLDSLNASIVSALPLTQTNSVSGAGVVVGAELAALFRQAAIASLDWLTEPGPLHDATIKVLRHVDNNIDLYVSNLSRMLETRDQWLPFVASGDLTEEDAMALRNQLESNLRYSINAQLQAVRSSLQEAGLEGVTEHFDYAANNLLDEDVSKNPITRLQGLAELPAADSHRINQWQGVAELLLTKRGEPRKRLNKAQGFPAGGKEIKASMQAQLALASEAPIAIEQLHRVTLLPPPSYADDQWNVLLALFRVLPLAVGELKRLFLQTGVIDHTEVALSANSALGSAASPGDIALMLDYQIQHLLVDEMQDTSYAQYEMLAALTGGWSAGDGRSLYCVGDPMQSIYRFRNAEVGQFLRLQESGIGNLNLEALLLRQNFRSGENLVNWYNDVFPSVFARAGNVQSGAVRYDASLAVPQLADQGKCCIHPIFGSDANDEAGAGIAVLTDILQKHPNESVAVLVRGRSQLPQLLARLREANVGYRAVEIDRLTDLPEIIDLLALTRAAVHRLDRIAWLGVLRGAWIGLDWTDLHALVSGDPARSIWELLNDPKRIASLSDYAQDSLAHALPVLQRLACVSRLPSLRERVEAAWFALGGPAMLHDDQEVENVYRYLDVLERMDVAGSLADVAELETILDQERVSTSDDARLQIMTMHRAKGLQFDHVLLFGLGRKTGQSSRPVMSWFDVARSDSSLRKVISPIGPRADVERDPIHRYIQSIEAKKDDHEIARLLYVACTRAKSSLHLMGHVEVGVDGDGFRKPRSDSLLHRLWHAVEGDYEAAFSTYTAQRTQPDKNVMVQPVLRRLQPQWELPDAKSIPAATHNVTADEEVVDNKVEFYWVGNDARIAGTLVHRWLQKVADGVFTAVPGDIGKNDDVIRRWLNEFGIADDDQQGIIERVKKAVRAMLLDPKGQWIVSGEGHAELRLTGVYENELRNVVLDRVRIDEQGTHWIIDYKTSTHEGGNLAGFLAAEVDRYKPQLQQYAAIYSAWSGLKPRCALYFPLLSQFVETDL